MGEECRPITLTIPSDLRLVAVVRTLVETVCRLGGFDRPTTDSVVLATHEAVNNVIRHAHQSCPWAQVQVQCHLGPDCLEVYVLDEGEPFNLDSVPNLNPAELRIGGRGVFLMRTLMDELTCQPRGDRGNALRMVKRRCGPPGCCEGG